MPSVCQWRVLNIEVVTFSEYWQTINVTIDLKHVGGDSQFVHHIQKLGFNEFSIIGCHCILVKEY